MAINFTVVVPVGLPALVLPMVNPSESKLLTPPACLLLDVSKAKWAEASVK